MREFEPPSRRTLPSRYLFSSPVPPRHVRWTAPLRRRPGTTVCALSLLLLLPVATGAAPAAPGGLPSWVTQTRSAGWRLLFSGHDHDGRSPGSRAPASSAGPAAPSAAGSTTGPGSGLGTEPGTEPVPAPAPDPGAAAGTDPAPGGDGTGELVSLTGGGAPHGAPLPEQAAQDGTVRSGRRPAAGAGTGRGGGAPKSSRPAASTEAGSAPGKSGGAGKAGGTAETGHGTNAAHTETGAEGWAAAECRRRFPADATRRAACTTALTGALGR